MNKYDKKLRDKHNLVKDCEHRVDNSCIKCKQFFECEIRKDYVDSVYKSMSKGKFGGFEF